MKSIISRAGDQNRSKQSRTEQNRTEGIKAKYIYHRIKKGEEKELKDDEKEKKKV